MFAESDVRSIEFDQLMTKPGQRTCSQRNCFTCTNILSCFAHNGKYVRCCDWHIFRNIARIATLICTLLWPSVFVWLEFRGPEKRPRLPPKSDRTSVAEPHCDFFTPKPPQPPPNPHTHTHTCSYLKAHAWHTHVFSSARRSIAIWPISRFNRIIHPCEFHLASPPVVRCISSGPQCRAAHVASTPLVGNQSLQLCQK